MRASPTGVVTKGLADQPVHVPKNPADVETTHKVVRFGSFKETLDEEEDKLYKFLHQSSNLQVSKGCIPINFLSYVPLNEGDNLYLETRDGGYNKQEQPVGPEYQIRYTDEGEIIGGGQSGWSSNLDELWTFTLGHFERKNLLSEDTLDDLDADPFIIFGIDDPVTQQALRKLHKFPSLMCEGAVPHFDEWAVYLNIDPTDFELRWLVQAFLETELPKPWTCYKGVGSVVCYIRADKGQVTWKHPFYDYFRQLRDFCREALANNRHEEIMKVRCNRLLWSYEASRVETDHEQEPLVSPDYLTRMADIFGYDVTKHGCVVRNLKAQLKVFARSYRERQDVDMADVINCAEILQRDVEKYSEMQDHWMNKVKEDVQFDLDLLSNGELQCVNCGTIALCFCLECKDYLCLSCYDSLHEKGARRDHAPFRLVSCGLCVTAPAKLHCTFTDKSLCHRCYAMDHIKQLPPDGKENKPQRIDYMQQYSRYADFARERNKKMRIKNFDAASDFQEESYESVLSTDWHPFYDARGVKFYHNFVTGERMRQSPRKVPNTADPGAEAAPTTVQALTNGDTHVGTLPLDNGTQPLVLHGFDALETYPLARHAAADFPEHRPLRPPYRKHMPAESQPF